MPTFRQLSRKGKTRIGSRPKRNSILAFAGAPFRRGVVYKVTIQTPRKPNSAKRKIVKVRLHINQKKVFANIPGLGHKLREYSVVILRGGSAKDLPGVNCTVVRGILDFTDAELFGRKKRRSKFGLAKKISDN